MPAWQRLRKGKMRHFGEALAEFEKAGLQFKTIRLEHSGLKEYGQRIKNSFSPLTRGRTNF